LKEFLKPGFDDRGNEEGEINYQALHIESLVEQDLGLSKHLIQKLNNDNVERLKKINKLWKCVGSNLGTNYRSIKEKIIGKNFGNCIWLCKKCKRWSI